MTAPPEWRDALDPLRAMLAADGYDVDVTGSDPVHITIVPTAQACGDCLVPESVMRPLIEDMVGERGIEGSWTLSLPASGSH